jgi:hypothetical protein
MILDRYDGTNFAENVNFQQLVTQKLRGLPFYNFQDSTDTNTFNHVIGLRKKNNAEFPLFDYVSL